MPRCGGVRQNSRMHTGTRVVIVGCGFGGLAAARALSGRGLSITVVDRTNHHVFQPLLYQVATAGLAAPAIAAPIRFLLRRRRDVATLLGDVLRIEPDVRHVVLDDGAVLPYDFLVIASGSTHSYYGHPEWREHAPGLKTLADAQDIRRRILLAYEFAERAPDAVTRSEWLTFAVVGAGPTGVELAGTLAEIAHHTLPREFRRIDSRQARILLIEGGPRVLGTFDDSLSRRAAAQLRALGVEVLTGTRVTRIDARGLDCEPGGRIAVRTVLWAAGVAASPLGSQLGAPVDRAGRVVVQPDLSVPGQPGIFVIGDLAAVQSDGRPVPGVGAAAKQMGALAARNVRARIAGRETTAFRYRDYGMLATIGRHAAVGSVGGLRMSGLPAWLFWLFVHLFYLIGFRNRVVVFIEWAWSYFTFERSARIVWKE